MRIKRLIFFLRGMIAMKYKKLLKLAKHIDRSFFIGDEFKPYSKSDQPLPIGYGQTISQPSLVWYMTFLLKIDNDCTVLEIGTGSGYQTALLAELANKVYTIERIPELGLQAKARLDLLGYENINYLIGDGSIGWKEYAPFDRIIVTAAAGKLPDELIEQLKNGGIMIIPVGPPNVQELLVITKDEEGIISKEFIEMVRFVEMKGKYGWE
jgi:protein-L-isoaspartate(D-aspartate) O-methyltransferase